MTSRPRALVNTNCDRCSRERSSTRSIAAPRRNEEVDVDLTFNQRQGRAFCAWIEHIPTDGLPTSGGTPATLTVNLDYDAIDGKVREAAAMLLEVSAPPGSTVGADKAFDVRSFVATVRALDITPHVAQKTHSAIDGRTTRHDGYDVSQRKRKLIEQVFGWWKTIAGLRKLRHRGGLLIDWLATFAVYLLDTPAPA